MSFRYRRKMILAKLENAATPGTDSSPSAADNSILTSNLQVTPYAGNTVQRNLDNGVLGSDESYNVGPMASLEFDVEIAGSSARGTLPSYDSLLKACGFGVALTLPDSGPPIVLGQSVYKPVSTGFASVSIYYNVDGQQQVFTSCRGSLSIRMDRGQLPYFHFSMMGLYTRPTAVAMYDPNFSDFMVPVPVNNQNTGTVSVQGYAAKLEAFNWDLNAEITHRNLPGNDSIEYIDRSPSGTIVLEAPTLATKDLFLAMESHDGVTKGPLQIVHGPAGNQVQVDCPNTQLDNLREGESDGIMTYTFDMITVPSDPTPGRRVATTPARAANIRALNAAVLTIGGASTPAADFTTITNNLAGVRTFIGAINLSLSANPALAEYSIGLVTVSGASHFAIYNAIGDVGALTGNLVAAMGLNAVTTYAYIPSGNDELMLTVK